MWAFYLSSYLIHMDLIRKKLYYHDFSHCMSYWFWSDAASVCVYCCTNGFSTLVDRMIWFDFKGDIFHIVELVNDSKNWRVGVHVYYRWSFSLRCYQSIFFNSQKCTIITRKYLFKKTSSQLFKFCKSVPLFLENL